MEQTFEPNLEEIMTDPVIKMETPHTDDRGWIQPLSDENMKSAVLIQSKKGTFRANHYHKTDWHYCYVLTGEINYYWRKCGETGEPEMKTIKKGELFFTPPLVEHTMVFAKDTEFICLGKNSRKQEVYEADIERVQLVAPTH